MRTLIAILLLTACQKEEPTFCFECHSREMPGGFTFCDYSEAEIRHVYNWRAANLRDTMTCKIVER